MKGSKNKRIKLVFLFVLYVLVQLYPSWIKVSSSRSGRDFASFYYAQKVSWNRGSPYDSKQLSRLSKKEKTRKNVHPFFYPPPSLLIFSWVQPFSLHTAYMISFFINHIIVAGLFVLFRNWLRIASIPLAFLFALCTPIGDCIMMGQINLVILFLIAWSVQKQRGSFLAGAAMIKMSPALILWPQIIWRKWHFVGWTITFAVIFSVIFLPFMGFDQQKSFYTDVLPQFSSGQYSGLKVPIHLSSNHSIPEFCAQWFPAEKGTRISVEAQKFSSFVTIGLLCSLSWLAWKTQSEIKIIGSFIVLMVLIPIYTYEHHLVFLLFPSAILLSVQKEHTRLFSICSYVTMFFLFWPLTWWKEAQNLFPVGKWWIQESKMFAALILMALLCYSAFISKERAD